MAEQHADTVRPYYERNGVSIYHGDCLDVLPKMAQKFDVIVTSPPYNKATRVTRGWQGKTPSTNKGGHLSEGYGQHGDAMPVPDYEAWQRDCLATFWEHLSDNGAIFYNHKPRLIDGTVWLPLVLNPGLPLRQIIVWATGQGVCMVPTALSPSHEWIMVLAKSGYRLTGGRGQSSMGDVWRVPPARGGGDHPAPFPVEIPRRVLTIAAGAVCDPFMGSGTTLVAALEAGRQAVGIEVNERYCEVAATRLAAVEESVA